MAQRPKVGLVLGGGGSRGLAHIGVLKILLREKIPIDLIVGIAGSIVKQKIADIGGRIIKHYSEFDNDLFAGRNIDAYVGILDDHIGGSAGIHRSPWL